MSGANWWVVDCCGTPPPRVVSSMSVSDLEGTTQMTITSAPVPAPAHRYYDADGNQIGLAIQLPSGVMAYGHDYDEQPAEQGFLYVHLDICDDFVGVEKRLAEHIALHTQPPAPQSPVCSHCGCDLEVEGDLLVDALSGDEGGTYDFCTDNPTHEHVASVTA